MSELELLLLESLKKLSAESAQREMLLSEQLAGVAKRLDTMTVNYQSLQQRFDRLTQQVKTLSEEVQK